MGRKSGGNIRPLETYAGLVDDCGIFVWVGVVVAIISEVVNSVMVAHVSSSVDLLCWCWNAHQFVSQGNGTVWSEYGRVTVNKDGRVISSNST